MLKTKALLRIAFLGATLAWLVMVFTDLTILFSNVKGLTPDVPLWLPRFMLNLYIIGLYYYYKLNIERNENLNFTDLLWKVFATGLVATVISLALRFILFLLGTTRLPSKFLFDDIIYQINLALLISFLVASFSAWKRLILYQKSKWLIRTWLVFEISLLSVLVYDSLTNVFVEYVSTTLSILLGMLALVLSANMKWVAYLNFKQKWTSLLLLLLTFFYLAYFFYTVVSQSESLAQIPGFVLFSSHTFFLSLYTFVLVYGIFSFLVITFNLPTSSVFEQKLEEVVNFQRISQSIQTEQSEESVYRILLESSVSSVFADAAWLDIREGPEDSKMYTYQIKESDAFAILDHLQKSDVKGVLDQGADKTRNLSKHLSALKGSRYRSILAFPIQVKGKVIGTLAILKELPEGFNKEMTRIIHAFANQASISIENFRLMEEAFQNERYKEELKIAKNVQKSLLPQKLESNKDFEIIAFSESADEVGGDYYDTIRVNEHTVAMIIADVSGKGTTAAFHMSQMKGVFHSLAQQELDPKEFMIRANQALVYCLERGSFISASFFVINSELKRICYARAGHCPVLYYSQKDDDASFLKDRGAALGMIRGKEYEKHSETNQLYYQPGDIMVLYTDGITEAKDGNGEEFGQERLRDSMLERKIGTPGQIQDHLINKLYEFSGSREINDDYTTMIVKFV